MVTSLRHNAGRMCSPLRIIGTALPAAMHEPATPPGAPTPPATPFICADEALPLPEDFKASSQTRIPLWDTQPVGNRTTDDGAALGRVLFHDRRLSITNTVASASCHQREHGFASPERFNTGAIGVPLPRNARALANGPNYRPRRSTRRCSMPPSARRRSPATAIRSNNAGGVCRTPQPPRPPKLLCARAWNRMRGSFVSPCMRRRSPFAAAGMVLGAVVCIMMLAYLAACGSKGF